jgi:hypothetical protein
MLSWYAVQADGAAHALAPARDARVTLPMPASRAPVGSSTQALTWFATELDGLTATVRQAAELGRHDVTAQIAAAMLEFFHRTPHPQTWLAVSQAGVDSARHLADDGILAYLLIGLGQGHSEMGHFSDAHRCFTEALDIRRRTGDRVGQEIALNCLHINLHRQEEPGVDAGRMTVIARTGT